MHVMRTVSAVVVTTCLCLACARVQGVPYNWTLSVVDNGGQYSSVAVDHNNRPHVVYMGADGHLHYGWQYGATWMNQVIDGDDNVGGHCRIVAKTWHDDIIGSYTDFHVAYLDGTLDRLKYAFKDPWSPWSVETVDDNVNIFRRCGLGVRKTGEPLVVFIGANGPVTMALKQGGSWNKEEVDNEPNCRLPDVALDEDDKTYLAYVKPYDDNDEVRVKYRVSVLDPWQVKSVQFGGRVGPICDPLVDDNGNLRIIAALNNPTKVVEALPFGQEGKLRVVDDDNVPILAGLPLLRYLFTPHSVDNDSGLHLLLVKPKILIHEYEESPLHTEVIDNGTYTNHSTVGFVVDSAGNLHATWYDAANDEFIYAYGELVPEPASMGLLALSVGAAALLRRRCRRRT